MKQKAFLILSATFFVLLSFFSCKKNCGDSCTHDPHQSDHNKPGLPFYSTPNEFIRGITEAGNRIQTHQVIAYKDTTRDGKPDINGRKEPLYLLVQQILQKLHNGNIEAAVYDVFHFDEATFSLISYLMKARMAGNISSQTLTEILAEIPLPPVAMIGFNPPLVPQLIPAHNINMCQCKPKVKIRATLVYVPDCGNYRRETTGYIVNNTLTGMSSGIYYRFVPEVEGCACGGTWTHTVEAPASANYSSSYSGNPGNGVSFQGLSAGTYKITFTYTCGCGCGASDSETVTIGIS